MKVKVNWFHLGKSELNVRAFNFETNSSSQVTTSSMQSHRKPFWTWSHLLRKRNVQQLYTENFQMWDSIPKEVPKATSQWFPKASPINKKCVMWKVEKEWAVQCMKPDRLRPVRFTVLKHRVTGECFPIAVTDTEGGFVFFSPSGRIQDVSQDVTEAMGRWESKATITARREEKSLSSAKERNHDKWRRRYVVILFMRLLMSSVFMSDLRKLRFLVGLFSWRLSFRLHIKLSHLTEKTVNLCRLVYVAGVTKRF